MDFTVSVSGPDPAKWGAKARVIEMEVKKALLASAQRVEKEAKESIARGPKSGRLYQRRSVTHRASAPGEAPATDTGRLINSINSYLDSTALSSFVVAGRGIVTYARHLEYGTANMAERPFMAPALERSKPFIRERMAKAVNDGIRK
ncbi:HK97 gp10 family phage protein [Gemmata sp. G18]|uniref:HK97 gp10 family phage protein n=1 Tax=Gemmata palustris TaxID=2822762 RepID=A0ABS5BX75_9BACT|nr:HK97 gp10 family phage protein [Gemmata palustris]MBP3958341.1 HK97 gp10 family phage protein [Gemmata palustris]